MQLEFLGIYLKMFTNLFLTLKLKKKIVPYRYKCESFKVTKVNDVFEHTCHKTSKFITLESNPFHFHEATYMCKGKYFLWVITGLIITVFSSNGCSASRISIFHNPSPSTLRYSWYISTPDLQKTPSKRIRSICCIHA